MYSRNIISIHHHICSKISFFFLGGGEGEEEGHSKYFKREWFNTNCKFLIHFFLLIEIDKKGRNKVIRLYFRLKIGKNSTVLI